MTAARAFEQFVLQSLSDQGVEVGELAAAVKALGALQATLAELQQLPTKAQRLLRLGSCSSACVRDPSDRPHRPGAGFARVVKADCERWGTLIDPAGREPLASASLMLTLACVLRLPRVRRAERSCLACPSQRVRRSAELWRAGRHSLDRRP